MRLRGRILERVRGPILAAATTCCAGSAPSAELTAEPAPIAALATAASVQAFEAPDPVAYDASAEHARLDRAVATAFRDEARRDRRVAATQEAERARRAAAAPPVPPPHYFLCGRG